MNKFWVGVFSLLLGWLGLRSWLSWDHFLNEPARLTSEEVLFDIPPGMNFKSITKELKNKELITNQDLFIILARLRGETNKVKTGEYSLNRNMKPTEILTQIVLGKGIERTITFSEGLSMFEVAALFQKSGLGDATEVLATIKDPVFIQANLQNLGIEPVPSSLEGYLFPETYRYTKYVTYKNLLAEMVNHFKAVWKEISPQSSLPWNVHQIVTLASIIEKETGSPEERPLISSVFHNRLNKRMLLQTDPTIIYGKAIKFGHMDIKISRSDILMSTSYNTYVIRGLPPGPIANPGRDSLLAAIMPAPSKYLYFVSHNDGTHQFSEDYHHHQLAVKKYQLNPSSRKGRSWRDLKNKKSSSTTVSQ